MTSPIRVLVVDDSATMRRLIRAALQENSQIEVIAEAADALEARDAIVTHTPDVVTLDIEMPGMSGLELLDRIIDRRPMPVIMISAYTQRGTQASVEALARGAFECFGKPTTGDATAAFEGLADLVLAAGRSNYTRNAQRQPTQQTKDFAPNGRVVAIGSSTGGVEALARILENFPANCPPTLITQHMPKAFTKSFADRLNTICPAQVREASDGDALSSGKVYVAPGGDWHLKLRQDGRMTCALSVGEPVSGHRPSVDVLFSSFVPLKDRAVGVILTGMGSDGAAGLLSMREAGARTIGQDQSSCVVYGMPRVAKQKGAVESEVGLHRIAATILDACNAQNRRHVG